MFRPSKWFGWNRSNGEGTAGGADGGNGSPMSRSSSQASIPHSLEHLKTLYNLLEKNQTVTEQNRTLLVETLRQISEILIWGDQNDSTVFDFFLEKNMLYFFLKIMKQKCGGFVCTQLLQTLNILFENIRNETSLYYLLSNNHVNSIIVHKFDFDDEEVMAYYISFLKTLSFKLNTHTVHFFFNEHTADFPLYTEAIKFFNHPEKMVRIAVRTLTLNVFRVRENAMLRFIRDCTAAPYFSNLSWFIGNHVVDIESSLTVYIDNKRSNGSNVYSEQNLLIRLEDLIAEHLDHLHYMNDILLLNIDDLNTLLSDNLLHRMIIPLYLHSILSVLDQPTDSSPQKETKHLNTPLSPNVAIFLLTQAYIIFSYGPLLNTLVNFLLRSSQIDIDFNAKRCEFTPPNSSLEAAISQAISTTVNSTNHQESSNLSSEESTPSEGTKALFHGTEASHSNDTSQNQTPNAQMSSQSMEEFKRLYFGQNKQNQNHDGNHNHVMETETFPVQVITIRNWHEFPFLIAMLSTLNAHILSANTPSEASTPSGRPSSLWRTEPSTGQDDILSKSCHSPSVTRSLMKLSCPDDRVMLFTLSMFTSILSNKAIDCSFYRGLLVPSSSESSPSDSESTNSYCSVLINSLLLIMRNCCSTNSTIRIVTFELAVHLFKRIIFYYHHLELVQSSCPKSVPIFLSDHQLAILEQANEEAAHILRQYFASTDQTIFLDLFEQEAEIAVAANAFDDKTQLERRRPSRIWSHSPNLNLEQLFMDSTLMLPPEEISPSSHDSNSYLRLPLNEYERTRYAIKVFFVLHRLSLDVRGGSATEVTENMPLPEKQTDFLSMLLDSTEPSTIALNQFLDLENSDINSCSIRFFYPLNQSRALSDPRVNRRFPSSSAPVSRSHSPSISVSSRKISRFMVITAEHVILIEPDTKHYGWGVIRFIARLQDLEFWSHAHALTQTTTPPIPRKERDDAQSIYVYFRRYQMSTSMSESSFSGPSQPSSIVIRFSFDDQIRCYAAKQHLTKAQSKVHDRKIAAIIRLIDLNVNEPPADSGVRGDNRPNKANKSGDQVNSARKKTSSSSAHPLLSRSLAVPGGAVLSVMTTTTDPNLPNPSTSALNKFDMLNKTKYAYPINKVGKSAKSTTTTPDSEIKKKKKLKNPLPIADDGGGIPLNDLSPKTVRRATTTAAGEVDNTGKGADGLQTSQTSETYSPTGSESANPISASSARRKTLTETIDI